MDSIYAIWMFIFLTLGWLLATIDPQTIKEIKKCMLVVSGGIIDVYDI
jgi:hypothetical protein